MAAPRTVAALLQQMQRDGSTPQQMIDALMERAIQAQQFNRLETYKPFPKQIEFHNAGFNFQERLLRAPTQIGKSVAGAAETAIHLTGRYPAWWAGRRFDHKVTFWVVSEDWLFSKTNAQRLLMGPTKDEWGTGFIPKECIEDYTLNTHSTADTLESVIVKSDWGGKSIVQFKSADVERNKLGGGTIHGAWADEEAKVGHYEEITFRINVNKGIVYTTFTPLKGATDVVNRFLRDKAEGTHDTWWTIDDDNLYALEDREKLKARYKGSKDYMARLYAVPSQGDGNVFTGERAKIECAPFAIPDHFVRICALDIGWTHPAALSWWAIDRDAGISYLYAVWCAQGAKLHDIFDVWKNHGGLGAGTWIPVSFPADGDNETAAGAGVSVADQLRDMGMLMLGEPAMLPETGSEGEKTQGRKSVEAQVQMMDGEMLQGRIKVFSSCELFWKEYTLYHRENGKIVKKLNDVLDSARYGWIMRRYARSKYESQNIASQISSGKQNWRC